MDAMSRSVPMSVVIPLMELSTLRSKVGRGPMTNQTCQTNAMDLPAAVNESRAKQTKGNGIRCTCDPEMMSNVVSSNSKPRG